MDEALLPTEGTHENACTAAPVSEVDILRDQLQHFAYATSHDLQEPVRNIIAFCKILEEDHTDQLDDDGRECIDMIVRSGNRLSDMIEGLLMFSRTQRADLSLQTIPLKQMTDAVLERLRPTYRGTEFFVDIPAGTSLYTDELLFSAALFEILDNAAKYSAGRDTPEVRLTSCREENTQLIIVEDNGIGFTSTPDQIIFKVFTRLVPRSQFNGVGTGLAIAHEALTRLGGSVSAFRNKDRGARFSMRIPLSAQVE